MMVILVVVEMVKVVIKLTLLQVQKQCLELRATRPNVTVPPVELTLYYESLCPGCRDFITQQLYPTWTLLRDILRVNLVPYGNAKVPRWGGRRVGATHSHSGGFAFNVCHFPTGDAECSHLPTWGARVSCQPG